MKPEIFDENFFKSIIKYNNEQTNQLFIDFSNIFNIIVTRNHSSILFCIF